MKSSKRAKTPCIFIMLALSILIAALPDLQASTATARIRRRGKNVSPALVMYAEIKSNEFDTIFG